MANNVENEIKKYNEQKRYRETNIGDVLNHQAIRNIEEAKKDSALVDIIRDEEDNNDIPFSAKRFFFPLDLIKPDETPGGDRSNKPAIATAIALVILGIATMSGINFVTKELKIPLWVFLLVMLIITVITIYVIWDKMYYKTDEERAKRAKSGTGVNKSRVADVWGISPGGIRDTRVEGKRFQNIVYKGREAIVLKLIRKSILVTTPQQEEFHYRALADIENLLTKEDMAFTKVTMKFDPDNDVSLWTKLNSNLENAEIEGKNYIDVMHDILMYHHEYTKKTSTLNVMYYIVYPNFKIRNLTLEDAARKISKIMQASRIAIADITTNELMSLLKDYYGLEIFDANKLMDVSDMALDEQIQINLIKTINSKGELINIREIPKIKFPEYMRVEKQLPYRPNQDDNKLGNFVDTDLFKNQIYKQPSYNINFEVSNSRIKTYKNLNPNTYDTNLNAQHNQTNTQSNNTEPEIINIDLV